jgi:HPt (histidine-containing phosphotransfer) domain-containing protein
MTANALHGDRERCVAAGMDGYIPKPIAIAELARALRDCAAPTEERLPIAVRTSESEESAAPSPAVNRDAVAQLRELCGDDDELRRLVADHVANSVDLLASIKRGLLEGSREDVHRAAHSLKSTSGMFGAMRLSLAAAELEEATRHDLANAEPLVGVIERECQAAHSAFEAMGLRQIL